MDAHEQIAAWLRDAHAMEISIERILAQQVAGAADHPEFEARLRQHLEETREHAALVAECLESLGTTPSGVKSMAAGFMGALEGLSTGMFRDEAVKNALADYAVEHFEIGCYSALIAAAEEAGLQEISRTCSEILRSEAGMANWLELQIPELTKAYLAQQAAAEP